tara:strand:+ start:10366 stop:12072 length:1707 start_codon:yes stop_codon:yes gene_type:complete
MFGLSATFFLADYFRFLEMMAIAVAIVILISSVDDTFIDICYWVRRLYRRFSLKKKFTRLNEEDLRGKPEQPLAVMVPAWHEYDVIAPMLEAMIATLDYGNYRIYVGTYCNDARTIAEVERMRRRYRMLVRVEVPHPGPTCKADCLNWIVQAIFRDQQIMKEPYAGVILHDCEDVLHPLELKYFNYLLPRIDFIQLPVASLERHWDELVAGTYMDEFAESHAKDMVVREYLSGMVPSAGVGTCFSLKAISELANESANQPFNTSTLTEDYDIGARLARRGMKQIFAKFPVQYTRTRRRWLGLGKPTTQAIHDSMSVREYFPNTFRTAYRQKSRWTLGISLQGWKLVGWEGSLTEKYFFFRDRKGLVTSFVAVVAYFLVFNFILFQIADELGWWTTYYPTLFAPNSWAVDLLKLNLMFFIVRGAHRFYFVNRLYGWEHALLSFPRMIVGNFVNAMAAARAWRLFIVNYIFGTQLVWDKTMHDFPATELLQPERQRLGEILLSWRAVSETELEKALQMQREQGNRPLGEILLERQIVSDVILNEAIDFQMQWLDAQDTSASQLLKEAVKT